MWLVGEMIERAATLPEDRLDECVGLDVDDDVQSIRSLLSRLVGQLGMWNAAIGQYDYDWSAEDHESVLSLRARLAVDGPKYLAEVRRVVAAEELDETFVDALDVYKRQPLDQLRARPESAQVPGNPVEDGPRARRAAEVEPRGGERPLDEVDVDVYKRQAHRGA